MTTTTSVAQMHNPMSPGEFILVTYLEPYGVSARKLANALGVASTTVARILNGTIRITPEMALRLSTVLGTSPQFWLNMQNNYDLWEASQTLDLSGLQQLEFAS